jgi:uncharacterized protein YegJ (DUF2314 family)
MLGWLKVKAPLQGSVWFAEPGLRRPEDLPLFADARIARGEPEWRDGNWRMTALHPLWGSLTLMGVEDPPPWPIMLSHFVPLTKGERAAVEGVKSALYVELPAAGENVLRERKTMLRALSAIGGGGLVAAVDHMAQRLWTAADLAEELAHDADLDIESALSLHAIMGEGDDGAEWVHTHGLAELGGFDFHIVQPEPGRSFNPRTEAVRALAAMILEGRVKADGSSFPLFGGVDACFVPSKEFLAKAEGHAVAVLRRGIADDEVHGRIGAVLCEAKGSGALSRLFGGPARPRAHAALWSEAIEGAAVTAFTDGMTALMSERARATYPLLRRLAEEFASYKFPIGIKMGYETAGGGREHLWFKPETMSADEIDATLESPPMAVRGLKLGDRGTHAIERISDWIIGTPAGMITPRSLAAARIVREAPDEIRAAMAAGWPG